jgi:hypothetical protein
MDIASVFEWFAQETAHIAEQANEVRRRETLGKLALLWAAAAAEQRNKQQTTSKTSLEGIVSKRSRFALPIRTFAGLAQVQEPGSASGKARGGRGLGEAVDA